ncbi:MAG: DUF938 domain-containing protein [Sphingomonadaceae bacterium]|nr:DUF938 domain-containing protein [Sphingomonadaceae bacterium]
MDARETSPAAERNAEPILSVLREVLPPSGLVLELASGTGQHAAHFAAALPGLDWQPSEPDRARHASIRAWTCPLPNVRPPLSIDVMAPDWGVPGPVAAVLAINLIHIAPWEATLSLLDGAAGLLARPQDDAIPVPPQAPPREGDRAQHGQGDARALILYGPYLEGAATAESNLAFDRSLRARDPRWGVRDLTTVLTTAEAAGFTLDRIVRMPAENRMLVLRRM